MNKNELSQFYYGMDYDALAKDKQEHIDTQIIIYEEDKNRDIRDQQPLHPDNK